MTRRKRLTYSHMLATLQAESLLQIIVFFSQTSQTQFSKENGG